MRICARMETSSAETGSSATIDARLERECARDGDALALATGELVRKAIDVGARRPQADKLEQALHLAVDPAGRNHAVQPERARR